MRQVALGVEGHGRKSVVVTIRQPVLEMPPGINGCAGRELRIRLADSHRLAIEARLAIDARIGGATAKGQTRQRYEEDFAHVMSVERRPWQHKPCVSPLSTPLSADGGGARD